MKDFKKEEMISIAQRENNEKRAYLFVNAFQAKHIPVSPLQALSLFEALAKKVYSQNQSQKMTIIGFAETATAIGSGVAGHCPRDAYYIHTSRENMPKKDIVVEFQEEHSHATEQILFCEQKEKMLFQSKKILFVEDEITTGKTILNFVQALKQKGIQSEFAACSIVNSMTQAHREVFLKNNIQLYQLFTMEQMDGQKEFSQKSIVLEKRAEHLPSWIEYQTVFGKIDPRLGTDAKQYQMACEALANKIYDMFEKKTGKNILVLGTEECMYPAIVTGAYFEKRGKNVKTHSTTRSPIVAREEENYPIFNKSSFESVYEKGRKTYLYNLTNYDTVIMITDAHSFNKMGVKALLKALKNYGNDNIIIIRWKEHENVL